MEYPTVPYRSLHVPESERMEEAAHILEEMGQRRSVRHFSDREVPRELVETAILAASTAPSGAHLGTTSDKPFLETAPWLVVIFEQRYGVRPDGSRQHHYYVKESVGIAAGMFIDALHRMGLATLTHTPSPMAFLRTLLNRPENERPFILFPIGYAADDCEVPDLDRKSLGDVMIEVTDDDLGGA
jgi:nitroreductase